MPLCPVCSGTTFSRYASAAELETERGLREAFVQRRLSRPATAEEMKDLTDFFHQAAADLVACKSCGLLVRQELERTPVATYAEEGYDPSVMDRQFPAYVEAFRKKEATFRPLLPRGAAAIEIGSHYGAFLGTAQSWGWRIEGVDIGRDTSRFAEAKGFRVHRCVLPECKFAAQSFDGVFVWNCFEQIEDPAPLLAECKRILKAGGLLVLRTPNALFYRTARRLLASGTVDQKSREFLVDALGYNNLLGFPYLYGYDQETLTAVAARAGFRFDGAVSSELLTFPLPENPPWVQREERTISDGVALLSSHVLRADGVQIGPWIEVWFRT